jgi:hypothetical protein
MTVNSESTRLAFLVGATPDEAGVLSDQVARFEEQTGIAVELMVVPFADFNERLLGLIAAGTPPDVAALSYDFIAYLQRQDLLVPLEKLGVPDREDFRGEALQSNIFNDQLYALPWQQASPSPRFNNLALFEASQRQQDALSLIDFLTQPEQQEQNYDQLQQMPTRQSVFGKLEVPELVKEVRAIYATPEEVNQAIELVQARAPGLEPVLEGQKLNPYESATVVEEGKHQGTGAPVTGNVSDEVIQSKGSDSLIMGGLFVDHAPEYPQGDYAVKIKETLEEGGGGTCQLVTADGQAVEVEPEVFEDLPAPVAQPFCVVEEGSKLVCWYYKGKKVCIRVG